MNIYANAFNCAQKNDGSEFVLELIQEHPLFDEEGIVSGTEREIVGSFVMQREAAQELARAIFAVVGLSK